MLEISYGIVVGSMVIVGLYLLLRCRGFITSISLALGALLLFHGPAYIYYLSKPDTTPIFRKMQATPFFEAGIFALNISLAIMFLLVMLGAELVSFAAKMQSSLTDRAIEQWSTLEAKADPVKEKHLLAVVYVLGAGMLLFSIYENQLGTILRFVGSQEKEAVRATIGGSTFYPYGLALASIAPLMVAWCVARWRTFGGWKLALASTMIIAATMIGKLETLQKANAPLFVLQILLALYLMRSNKITVKVVIAITILAVGLLGPAVVFAVAGYQGNGVFGWLFYRIFEIPNEVLVEHFVAFPAYIPHTMGANIRPLAFVLGQPFVPTYDTVAFFWRGASGSTSTAMFIGDAWDAFSYAGVAGSSLAVGALCRTIDIVFLRHGRTPLSAAILSASFMGVYSLMISGLQTAAVSGGLLLSPVFALILISISRRLSAHRPPKVSIPT
jgi:hypothetical protein